MAATWLIIIVGIKLRYIRRLMTVPPTTSSALSLHQKQKLKADTNMLNDGTTRRIRTRKAGMATGVSG